MVVVAEIRASPETATSFSQARLAPAVTIEVHCEGNDGLSNPVLERLYPVGQHIVCVVESSAEVRTSWYALGQTKSCPRMVVVEPPSWFHHEVACGGQHVETPASTFDAYQGSPIKESQGQIHSVQ